METLNTRIPLHMKQKILLMRIETGRPIQHLVGEAIAYYIAAYERNKRSEKIINSLCSID